MGGVYAEKPVSRAKTGTQASRVFPDSPQRRTTLHRLYTGIWRFLLAGNRGPGAKSENTISEGLNKKIDVDQDTVSCLSTVRGHWLEDAS